MLTDLSGLQKAAQIQYQKAQIYRAVVVRGYEAVLCKKCRKTHVLYNDKEVGCYWWDGERWEASEPWLRCLIMGVKKP